MIQWYNQWPATYVHDCTCNNYAGSKMMKSAREKRKCMYTTHTTLAHQSRRIAKHHTHKTISLLESLSSCPLPSSVLPGSLCTLLFLLNPSPPYPLSSSLLLSWSSSSSNSPTCTYMYSTTSPLHCFLPCLFSPAHTPVHHFIFLCYHIQQYSQQSRTHHLGCLGIFQQVWWRWTVSISPLQPLPHHLNAKVDVSLSMCLQVHVQCHVHVDRKSVV